MFDTIKFGANLCRLRKNADMTAATLADSIGVTVGDITRWERGESFPDMSVVSKAAGALGVSSEELLNAGEPTPGELDILARVAEGGDASPARIEDIAGVAPLLRPSVLEKLVSNFSAHGIDISYVVKLAEYLNDKSVIALLEQSSPDKLDEELLGKFVPLLDDRSKSAILQRILDGELDYHFIRVLLPYASYYIDSQVEAAVVEGALPWDALDIMREALEERQERERELDK